MFRRARARVEIDKFFKSRVNVARALKGKGVEDSIGVGVMLVIMLKLTHMCSMSSLTMPLAVGQAGRCSNEVAKIRIVGDIEEGDEDIRAKAGGRVRGGVSSVEYEGSRGLEGVVVVHPRG